MTLEIILGNRNYSSWSMRARARGYAGEVHSGLNALRAAMPVNARERNRRPRRTLEVEADIARVAAIWETAENHPGGALAVWVIHGRRYHVRAGGFPLPDLRCFLGRSCRALSGADALSPAGAGVVCLWTG